MNDLSNDRCSLLQAALFEAQGLHPVAEQLFRSAPLQLSESECQPEVLYGLVRLLASGQVRAWGVPCRRALQVWREEKLQAEEIRKEFWEWPYIRWNASSLILMGEVKIRDNDVYLTPISATEEYFRDLYYNRFSSEENFLSYNYEYSDVVIDSRYISNSISNSSSPDQNKYTGKTDHIGRTRKYNWDEFFAEIVVLADLDKLPSTQSELVAHMAEWCLENWKEQPGETWLKARTALIYKHLRKVGN